MIKLASEENFGNKTNIGNSLLFLSLLQAPFRCGGKEQEAKTDVIKSDFKPLLGPPLAGCINLGKSLNCSEHQLVLCKMMI